MVAFYLFWKDTTVYIGDDITWLSMAITKCFTGNAYGEEILAKHRNSLNRLFLEQLFWVKLTLFKICIHIQYGYIYHIFFLYTYKS